MTAPEEKHVGHFARSIESGWWGQVVAVEGDCYKMVGVDMTAWTVGGGHAGDYLSPDDVQWFTPEDVRFCKELSR